MPAIYKSDKPNRPRVNPAPTLSEPELPREPSLFEHIDSDGLTLADNASAVVLASPGRVVSQTTAQDYDELVQMLSGTGTAFFRGFLDNAEYNASLRGTAAAKIYEKMRRSDAQVRASLRMIMLPIMRATWAFKAFRINEDGTEEPAEDVEKDLKHQFDGMLSLNRTLYHLLLSVVYGFTVMEKQWMIDDEGKWWIKRLQYLGSQTVTDWNDQDGELAGVGQQSVWKDGSYRTVNIPEKASPEAAKMKLVHIANDMDGNNYEGISLLRSAYKYWFIKENVERIAAIAIERHGLGVPHGKLTEGFSASEKTALQTVLKNLKSGSASYLIDTPHTESSILGTGDGNRYDPMPLIRYCDEKIMTNVLAEVMNLGNTANGSRALGGSMLDVFLQGEESVADDVADSINTWMIQPFLQVNYPDAENIKATVEWSDLRINDPKTVADSLQKLVTIGAIRTDDKLENHLRPIYDLPVADPDTAREIPKVQPYQDQVQTQMSAHKHTADCGHNTQTKTLAARRTFWRELTSLEKHVALREIDGRQDDAQEKLVDMMRDDRQEWAASLREQIRAAIETGKVSNLGKIAVPAEMRKEAVGEIVEVERELFRYGRRTVADELNRQRKASKKASGPLGSMMFRDEPPESDEIADTFKHRANMFIDDLMSRASSLAVAQATGLMRAKGKDVTDEDLGVIEAAIRETFDAATRNGSSVLVTEALNQGRDNEAQRQGVSKAIYSAILDENTCTVCFDEDGEEYDVGTPEYYAVTPPHPQCESTASGNNYCRCLWIYEEAVE